MKLRPHDRKSRTWVEVDKTAIGGVRFVKSFLQNCVVSLILCTACHDINESAFIILEKMDRVLTISYVVK